MHACGNAHVLACYGTNLSQCPSEGMLLHEALPNHCDRNLSRFIYFTHPIAKQTLQFMSIGKFCCAVRKRLMFFVCFVSGSPKLRKKHAQGNLRMVIYTMYLVKTCLFTISCIFHLVDYKFFQYAQAFDMYASSVCPSSDCRPEMKDIVGKNKATCYTTKNKTQETIFGEFWGYCQQFFPFKICSLGNSLPLENKFVRNPCWPVASPFVETMGKLHPVKSQNHFWTKNISKSNQNSKHHQGRMWFWGFCYHAPARSVRRMVATILDFGFFPAWDPVFRKSPFDFFRRSNPSKASTFARTFFGSWYHCGTCMLSV